MKRILCTFFVLLFSGLLVASPQVHTFPALDTANTFTALQTFNAGVAGATGSFSGQITSTLATGTAPFSVASTTTVANLSVQLHNGLTAPGSAIVGISDTQTLTNKTLTRVQAGTTAPTCSVTGAGTGATCSIASNSNDNSGNLQINTGTTPGTSGTWTLTFNAGWPSAGFCSVSLGNANTTLNARATVFNNSNGSSASQSGPWDNNGVAPTASQATAFLINYVCVGH